jgi:hypothetical protein
MKTSHSYAFSFLALVVLVVVWLTQPPSTQQANAQSDPVAREMREQTKQLERIAKALEQMVGTRQK